MSWRWKRGGASSRAIAETDRLHQAKTLGRKSKALTFRGELRAIRRNRRLTSPLIVAVCLLASGFVVAPFFYSNPPGSRPGEIRYAHDLTIHLAVMEQYDKVLRSGTIYPRWLPDVNYGYGNAWPNFYPPGFYYLSSLVNAIVGNWITTLFVIASLGLAGSVLAFYVLASAFFGRAASAIAAVLYGLLPYHLIDFFWRGAMPEFLSFILLPLILFFVYRVGSRGGARSYAGLGLCYGLSLLLHTPIAYLFSYVLVLYALAWAVADRDWRIALRIFLGMSAGVFLSAIYWLPAITEIKYAAETVTRLFNYHNYYVTRMPNKGGLYEQLLLETFVVQSSAFVVLTMAWLMLTWRRFGRSEAQRPHMGIWAGLGLLAIFMNLPESYSIARMIPNIEIVAFPSRWLAFVCLFAALLTGAVAERLVNQSAATRTAKLKYLAAAGAAAIAVVSSIWFAAQSVIIGSRSNPMVAPYTEFLCDTYCPKGAGATAGLPRTEPVTLEPKTGTHRVIRWEPLYREAIITTDVTAMARFKTFNFPGWTAQLDGEEVRISSDPSQAQVVNIPPGSHTIAIMFSGTLPRKLGAFISLLGALAICGLAVMAPFRFSTQPKVQSVEGVSSAKATIKFVFDFCSILIVVAAFIWCASMLIEVFHLLDKSPQVPVYTQRPIIGEGSEANLSVGKTETAVVATDEGSLVEVLTAIAKGDDQKIESLLQSGRSFRVDQNARVRVLGLSGGKAMVAILEGSNAFRQGWVLEGWLK